MLRRLSWDPDGRDWPNRAHSRFVSASGLCWHLQRMGDGPDLLLIHGTAAATHSWGGLAPLLARRFRVLTLDLPGHGFSGPVESYRQSLPGIARALDGLLGVLDVRPRLVVGHSAGAAILARMCLDGRIAPQALISLNGALRPFAGAAGRLYSPMAKLLAQGDWMPRLIARQAARPGKIERLIDQTGSRLGPDGIALYRRLVCSPAHVAATLAMVARWDLAPLLRDLPRLEPELFLIAADKDQSVPPAEAALTRAQQVPSATLIPLPDLGHLAHEERPDEVAALIERIADQVGL
ncbi:alpha/beta fold hydrolase BchO [Thioalkalicoccus limnaeus]|uniref:Alpha/beta fold hydrolase BchO n=1 Tax=Thioalkalicoccus limnaeus TaxID=120681 RepID=A0ABV4BIF2_9GAMM